MDGDGTRGRKRELRRHYREVRSALGEDGRARRDAAIAGRVKRLPEYLAADTVLTYLSVGDEVDTRELAIVPGLSVDERGYRMGYGGGFYDVFLADFAGVSVGLCREPQMSAVGALALDGHDVPVDVVVTEGRVIRPSR